MQELLDENAALAFRHKNSMSESQSLLAEMEALKVLVFENLPLLNVTRREGRYCMIMSRFLVV